MQGINSGYALQQQSFFMRMRDCCSHYSTRIMDLGWIITCAGICPSSLAYSSGKVFSVHDTPPWFAPSALFLLTVGCPIGFYAAYKLKVDESRETPIRYLIALYMTSVLAGFTFGFNPECRIQPP